MPWAVRGLVLTRVYSNLKFFGYPKHLGAIKAEKIASPVHVRIKPINHCNHGCWYCAYCADQLQLGEGMDLQDRILRTRWSNWLMT